MELKEISLAEEWGGVISEDLSISTFPRDLLTGLISKNRGVPQIVTMRSKEELEKTIEALQAALKLYR